jgi:predicted PhzF superfamily epimerase YddE/YHI9
MTSAHVLRVFVDDDGAYGNELGVIAADETTAGREQQIATELGFSETIFVESVTDSSATVRIYTPAIELPFAGHPTVGITWWLGHEGTPVTALHCTAGDVAVRSDEHGTWVTAEPDWAPEFAWIPTETDGQLAAIDPASFGAGAHYAFVEHEGAAIRSRMFAPVMGIAEDEATGAAAVRVTALLGRDLDITQGRGSRIQSRLLPSGAVEIGGRTVFDRTIEVSA